MKRSEIKIGETYGVRLSSGQYSTIMPATVVALDVPYTYRTRGGYSSHEHSQPDGGIRVRFTKPTRVGWNNLADASKTSDNAGKIEEEYVFGDKKNGSAAKCFVGLWADIEAQRKTAKKNEQAALDHRRAKVEEFTPVLDAYLAKLALVGLQAKPHRDFSGITGQVHLKLYSAALDEQHRSYGATGFAHDDVGLAKGLFDQLLDFAVEHSFTFEHGETDDEEAEV